MPAGDRVIVIEKSLQLLVEGQSAKVFMMALLRHLNIESIQVHDFGGVNDLARFLKAFKAVSGFQQTVMAMGIIRDAERANANSARQSILSALKSASLPLPDESGLPRILVYILPDNQSPGMLETLCWQSVQADPAIPCVNQFMDCLSGKASLSANPDKARLQAFLSSRPKFVAQLGEAAHKGYWPWDDPAFSGIKRFLIELELGGKQPL